MTNLIAPKCLDILHGKDMHGRAGTGKGGLKREGLKEPCTVKRIVTELQRACLLLRCRPPAHGYEEDGNGALAVR